MPDTPPQNPGVPQPGSQPIPTEPVEIQSPTGPLSTEDMSDFERRVAESFSSENGDSPSEPGTPALATPDGSPQAGGEAEIPPGSDPTGGTPSTPTTPSTTVPPAETQPQATAPATDAPVPGAGQGEPAEQVTPPAPAPGQGEPQPISLTYREEGQDGQLVERQRQFTPDEMDRVVATYQWAEGLTEQATSAIDGVLSGEYVLVPKAEVPTIQAFYARQQQQQIPPAPTGPAPTAPVVPGQQQPYQPPAPQAQPAPVTPQVDWSELAQTDPALAQAMQAQQQQIEAMRAQLEQSQQAVQGTQEYQAQIAQQRFVADIDVGKQAFAAEHPEMTPADLNSLFANFRDSGIFSALAPRHATTAEAVKAGLNQTLWSDPTFRQRAIEQEAANRAAALHTEQAAAATRQAQANALSGSGGSVSRLSTEAPKNQKERDDAMLAEIAADMNATPTT